MRTARSRSGAEPGTQVGETARRKATLAPSPRRAVCNNRLDILLLNWPHLVATEPFRRVPDAAGPTSGWDDSRTVFSADSLLIPRQASPSGGVRDSLPSREGLAP